jgi:hypothetical protein
MLREFSIQETVNHEINTQNCHAVNYLLLVVKLQPCLCKDVPRNKLMQHMVNLPAHAEIQILMVFVHKNYVTECVQA